MLARFRVWVAALKRDVLTLYLAMRDARVPWYVKILAGLVAGYALSPIDLIPDFIPILGYLDDVILLPLGIFLTLKLIPPAILDDLRQEAVFRFENRKPRSNIAAAIIIIIWFILILSVVALIFTAQSG